jgi:hypothetical protein
MSPEFLDSRDYDSDGDDEVRLIRDEQPEGAPDTSPLLHELTADDFPSYFSERGGRLFHSHHSSPYPLPADTPEQQVKISCITLSRAIEAYHEFFLFLPSSAWTLFTSRSTD